jgi:hypothetical protein
MRRSELVESRPTAGIGPIPGTTKLYRLEENLGSVGVELTVAELSEINAAASKIEIKGELPEAALKMTGPLTASSRGAWKKESKTWPLDPLVVLAREHFRSLLNQNGLFDKSTDANFCLECFAALDKLRPGLWENCPFEVYKVVGVYVVPVDD